MNPVLGGLLAATAVSAVYFVLFTFVAGMRGRGRHRTAAPVEPATPKRYAAGGYVHHVGGADTVTVWLGHSDHFIRPDLSRLDESDGVGKDRPDGEL